MADTDVLVNFYGSTAATTPSGITYNQFSGIGSTGNFLTGALQENGDPTDFDFSIDATLTNSNTGFSTGGSDIDAAMFAQMSYVGAASPAAATITIDAPGVLTATIESLHGTTFGDQNALDIDLNSETTQTIDASGEAGKAVFTNIAPNGSDQYVLTVTNNGAGSPNFAAWNGVKLLDIVYAGILITANQSEAGDSQVASLTVEASDATITANQSEAGDTQSAAVFASTEISITASQSEAGDVQASTVGNVASISMKQVFSDDFSGDGPFDGSWAEYNPSVLPNAQRVNGQFNSGSITAVGSTVWFNSNRGYGLYKEVDFPESGFTEIILHNAGIGPSTDPAANLPFDGPAQGAFGATLIAHDENLAGLANYEFITPCHRVTEAESTFEIKRTEDDFSNSIRDEGDNAVGVGVTHADTRLLIYADKHLEWYYRAVGDTVWTVVQQGQLWEGRPNTGQIDWSSDKLLVMITGYAFDSVPEAFTVTADSIEMVGEPTGVEAGDTQIASVLTLQTATVTASQSEAGDTQVATVSNIIQLNANQSEAGDTQSATIVNVGTRSITADQDEAGDVNSAGLTNVIQMFANQPETGDSQTAAIIHETFANITASQLEAGDSQIAGFIGATMDDIISSEVSLVSKTRRVTVR